jgi:hypothetical protein
MSFKTPTAIAAGVVCALAGVAGAALALPSSPPQPAAAVATATPAPQVRTETVRRTIHVERRARGRDDAPSRAATPARPRPVPAVATVDDSGHHRGFDDSGHHGGSGRHGGGHGRGGDDD